MQRYLFSAVFMFCVPAIFATQALADGVAVFASITDQSRVSRAQTALAKGLGVDVATSEVDINGQRWIRLHSAVMSERAARELVAAAERKGYSAWYNGSGNSLVTSSSAVAKALPSPTGALTAQPYSRAGSSFSESADSSSRWNASSSFSQVRDSQVRNSRVRDLDEAVVTPATGDISHLPMAETFPLPE